MEIRKKKGNEIGRTALFGKKKGEGRGGPRGFSTVLPIVETEVSLFKKAKERGEPKQGKEPNKDHLGTKQGPNEKGKEEHEGTNSRP